MATNKSGSAALAVVAVYFSIAAALFVGWVMNIIEIFSTDAAVAEWGVMEIMRVIGVFVAPLGGVLGYI